jgi:hypothetical protein
MEDDMKTLTEPIGSRVPEGVEEVSRETARAERVTVTVTGCGYEDQEVFDVLDVRAARGAMRKLMAAAIRQFGRSDTAEE